MRYNMIDIRDAASIAVNARITEMLSPQFTFPADMDPQAAKTRLEHMQKTDFAHSIVSRHMALHDEVGNEPPAKPAIPNLAHEKMLRDNARYKATPQGRASNAHLNKLLDDMWTVTAPIANSTAESYAIVVVDNALRGKDTMQDHGKGVMILVRGQSQGIAEAKEWESLNPQPEPLVLSYKDMQAAIYSGVSALVSAHPERYPNLHEARKTMKDKIAADTQPLQVGFDRAGTVWNFNIGEAALNNAITNYASNLEQGCNPMSLFSRPGNTSRSLVNALLKESEIDSVAPLHIPFLSEQETNYKREKQEVLRRIIMQNVRELSDKSIG